MSRVVVHSGTIRRAVEEEHEEQEEDPERGTNGNTFLRYLSVRNEISQGREAFCFLLGIGGGVEFTWVRWNFCFPQRLSFALLCGAVAKVALRLSLSWCVTRLNSTNSVVDHFLKPRI